MSSWGSIADLADMVNTGQRSAADLVERALTTIEQKTDYQAIISTLGESARQRAQKIDEVVAGGGSAGRLAGVPFIAKDNILTFGAETTAASNILRGFEAPYQATAIEKLEAEGAICVAKANLDAFAHGSSTENSDFMVTKNPHDTTRVPGGSSGGSAAAVVLDMAPFALGTDTGGSIRLPASYCGAVGYKPTYGLVSRSGVVAMASSMDVVGPLTRSVGDAALVLECISGKDELDATTIERLSASYSKIGGTVKNARIGIVEEFYGDGVAPGVRSCIDKSIEALRGGGATLVPVSIPSIALALAVYYILCPAEISSNLSRYDGLRYGGSPSEGLLLEDSYKKNRSIGFGKEAKRRILMGTYVLSSGYYDAYYKKAQIVRTKLINEFEAAFQTVDFLIGPTAPTTAFKIGEHSSDPLEMYLTDVMTVSANLVGVPSISLPSGMSQGLPVGVQLIAPQQHDLQLLSLAADLEKMAVA